jgi:hypothetical protein
VFSRADVVADVKRLSALVRGGSVTPLSHVDVEHHTIDIEFLAEPTS